MSFGSGPHPQPLSLISPSPRTWRRGREVRQCANLRPCAPATLRSGFTLLELMLALAIGGLLVLTAGRLFAVAGDSNTALMRARRADDLRANGREWLTTTLGSLEVGAAGTIGFQGNGTTMTFTAWVPTAQGWMERRPVTLTLAGGALIGTADGSVMLADSVRAGAFDYLSEYGEGTTWLSGWQSPVSAPIAIRIRLTRPTSDPEHLQVDTLVFRIGGRG
ncbi:MAG: PulJ/GspJ family protein [Gemmatimonadales bacterium]